MGAPRARSGLWRHREAGPARARLERHYRGADATSLSLGHASAPASRDLDAQIAAEELPLPLRQCPDICVCVELSRSCGLFSLLPLDCFLEAGSASGVKNALLPTATPPLPRRLFCCTECTSACDATLHEYYDVTSVQHDRHRKCWRYCKCASAMTSPSTVCYAPCTASGLPTGTPTPFPLPTTTTAPLSPLLPPLSFPPVIICFPCPPFPFPTDAPPCPSATVPPASTPTATQTIAPFPPSPSPTLTSQPPSPTLPTTAPSSSVSTFSTAPFPRPSLPPNSPPTASQTPARTPALAPAQIIGIFAGALVLAGILWGILLSRRAMRERALITPQLDGRTDRRSDASWVLSLRGVSGTGTFAGSLYRRIERGMSVQSGVTRSPGSEAEESSAMA